jgi:hypothetical protein
MMLTCDETRLQRAAWTVALRQQARKRPNIVMSRLQIFLSYPNVAAHGKTFGVGLLSKYRTG